MTNESFEKAQDTAGRMPIPKTWTGSPRFESQVTARFNVSIDHILVTLERLMMGAIEGRGVMPDSQAVNVLVRVDEPGDL